MSNVAERNQRHFDSTFKQRIGRIRIASSDTIYLRQTAK